MSAKKDRTTQRHKDKRQRRQRQLTLRLTCEPFRIPRRFSNKARARAKKEGWYAKRKTSTHGLSPQPVIQNATPAAMVRKQSDNNKDSRAKTGQEKQLTLGLPCSTVDTASFRRKSKRHEWGKLAKRNNTYGLCTKQIIHPTRDSSASISK